MDVIGIRDHVRDGTPVTCRILNEPHFVHLINMVINTRQTIALSLAVVTLNCRIETICSTLQRLAEIINLITLTEHFIFECTVSRVILFVDKKLIIDAALRVSL